MELDVQDKTALVTGGVQRVGKAISLMLASAGANIVNNYNRWGSVDDMTQAVKFLVEANCTTGDIIFVDGGEWVGQRRSEIG